MPRRRTVALATVAGIAVSVVFAAIAVADVDWRRFRQALEGSNLWWLVPAGALLAFGVVLRAARWRRLFLPEIRPPFRPVLRALLFGTFCNNVLPGRPGEAIRVFALYEETGTSRTAGLGTAFTERVLDVVTLLLLLFVVTPWLPTIAWLGRAAVAGGLLALVLALLVFSLLRWGSRPLRALLSLFRSVPRATPQRLDAIAEGLTTGLAALHRPRLAATALSLGVVSTLAMAASEWLVMFAFDLHLPFTAGVLVLVATNLAMILPSSPSALGVFEAATVVALRAYDVDASTAFSYAVVLHVLNSVPFILIGLGLVPRYGRKFLTGAAAQ